MAHKVTPFFYNLLKRTDMAKKVYGVPGMMEWHAVIPIGKSSMCVKFTGGTLSGYGITPAKYTTSDEVIQKMIENSPHFRSGKIILYRVYENDKKVDAVKPSVSEETPTQAAEKEIVEVASLDDAKEYLKENFGVAWNKLKTKASILEVAEKFNIEFVVK